MNCVSLCGDIQVAHVPAVNLGYDPLLCGGTPSDAFRSWTIARQFRNRMPLAFRWEMQRRANRAINMER